MKNAIFYLIFFSACSMFAQENSLITLTNDNINTLDSVQSNNYHKVTNRLAFDTSYFVEVGDLESLQVNNEITFQVPDKSCVITAKSYRINYLDSNNYSWSADIKPEDTSIYNCYDGNVILIKINNIYTGSFTVDTSTYTLKHLGEGLYLLSRFNFSDTVYSYCGDIEYDYTSHEPPTNIVPKTNTDNCPVSVLVLFTQAAEDLLLDIEATILMGIEKTNNAFFRSRVNFELQLAGIEFVNFQESIDPRLDVNTISNDANIIQMRDDADADLVVVMTNGLYDRTVGRVAEIGPDEDNAYAIVEAEVSDNTFVFPHEIGHLFGCRHQNDPTGTIEHANKFNNFIFWNKKTILWSPVRNSQVPHFSNPKVEYHGGRTGVWGERDNARQLINTHCEVASFETDNNPNELRGHISGPIAVCLSEAVPVQANISGGVTGTYQYNWSYSYDGFSYTNLNINDYSVNIPGVYKPPTDKGNYPIYIRVEITDQNNNSLNLFKSVEATNEDVGQSFPCTHHLTSNVTKVNDDAKITLMPNPSNSESTLLFNDNTNWKSYLIFDMNGNEIVNEKIDSNAYKQRLNLSYFPSGIYIIQLRSEYHQIIKRIIKL